MPNHFAVRGLASAVLLTIATAAYPQPPVAAPRGPDDRTVSAGRWSVVAVEWDGKPLAREFLSPIKVVYAADGSWAVLFGSIPVAEGRSTNHEDRSPKAFEMETLGSAGVAPTRYWGIYRLEGDLRVLCMTPTGKPRPEHFSAPKHSGRMLVTLKRVSE